MYLMATARKGISSLQLSKELGVTQKTAWFMLQRLREACGNDKDDDSNGFLRGISGVVTPIISTSNSALFMQNSGYDISIF
jgi:hypothetical protein